MKKQYTIRKFFNDIHLWLGIGSGLVIFIICLTGTLYAFHTEIERLLTRDKYYVTVPENGARLPLDTLVPSLEKTLKGKIASIVIPGDASMSYLVTLKGPGKKAGAKQPMPAGMKMPAKGEKEPKGKTYFINPYTGAVMGEQAGGAYQFFLKVNQIHRWLLLDNKTGSLIVGSATLIFVLLVISGLVIWFPLKWKNIKQGFQVKFRANWKRVNHDLHKTLGFYAFLVLLVISLSALSWPFEWYKKGFSKVLGAQIQKSKTEKPLFSAAPADSLAKPMSLDAHLAHAAALFAYEGDTRMILPSEPLGIVNITKNKTGNFVVAGTDRVQFDRFSGNALRTEYFSKKKLGEKIADSLKPIHTGEMFGLTSKIIYFLSCLIATSLPVTGTLIWINRLRKKSKRGAAVANRPLPQAAAVL